MPFSVFGHSSSCSINKCLIPNYSLRIESLYLIPFRFPLGSSKKNSISYAWIFVLFLFVRVHVSALDICKCLFSLCSNGRFAVFCLLAASALSCLVLQDEEVAMLSELSHLQEVVDQVQKLTTDPYTLPPASEQVWPTSAGRNSDSYIIHSVVTSPATQISGPELWKFVNCIQPRGLIIFHKFLQVNARVTEVSD
jgi:hypothetical protein